MLSSGGKKKTERVFTSGNFPSDGPHIPEALQVKPKRAAPQPSEPERPPTPEGRPPSPPPGERQLAPCSLLLSD